MKNNSTLKRYINDMTNSSTGENWSTIIYYFMPEFITNLIVYSMPLWLDSFFIAALESTATYATLGVTNNVIHLGIKVAEALSVSTVVLSGQFNGQQRYEKVGQTLRDAFWVTCLVGLLFFCILFFGGRALYTWYGVSENIISIGVPYLQLRALGVFFMFIYFAFVGFLRGIKNTRSPMKIFIFGAFVFVCADYVLIFGKYGFTPRGLQGSAIATILQYGLMSLVALGYIIFNKKNRKYGVKLLSIFSEEHEIKRFCLVSWPIILDKATIACAYIWLGKMIAPLGTNSVAAFAAIKDMERVAFLPAIALAQVITFLISNDVGARNIDAIKVNIKRVLLLGIIMVSSILLYMVYNTRFFLTLFDRQGDFTPLVLQVFPWISACVIFDLVQIILSGALRGTGNVHTVMKVRLCVVIFFFIPISYICTYSNLIESIPLKIILVYGSFYIGNGIMSLFYIQKFKSAGWEIST
ncbi:MAG TPA: MATE family efflux transporter [Patescibacteria group bacterium]|jgi:putative MATE family efflux protein|nr:MATE family efflux transporter [Patescibacteria group bacterium]